MARPPKYDQTALLEHIIERCELTGDRLKGQSFDAFKANPDLFDATAYRLQAIGEACGKLDAALTANYDLPWKEIIGMRQTSAMIISPSPSRSSGRQRPKILSP